MNRAILLPPILLLALADQGVSGAPQAPVGPPLVRSDKATVVVKTELGENSGPSTRREPGDPARSADPGSGEEAAPGSSEPAVTKEPAGVTLADALAAAEASPDVVLARAAQQAAEQAVGIVSVPGAPAVAFGTNSIRARETFARVGARSAC
jgi:hypothetical protein